MSSTVCDSETFVEGLATGRIKGLDHSQRRPCEKSSCDCQDKMVAPIEVPAFRIVQVLADACPVS